MNLSTIFLNSIVHIILVLIFEGIFLFAILYKIIFALSSSISIDTNNSIYNTINPLPVAYSNYYGYYNAVSYNYDRELEEFYYIDKNNNRIYYNKLKPIFSSSQKTICEIGKIDETQFLKTQSLIPYIVYGSLLFLLVIMGIIIVIISKRNNTNIDYKFIIINSIFVFILICAYATVVIFFGIFGEPYSINIMKNIYQYILDVYSNL